MPADLAARIARARACVVFGTPEPVVLALLDVAEAAGAYRRAERYQWAAAADPDSVTAPRAALDAALDKVREVLP